MTLDGVLALACDYDRTLTDVHLRLRPETLDALAAARRSGLRVVVVSGRDAAFLRAAVGPCADLLVAENGAFLVDPARGTEEPLFREWPTVERLAALGVPLDHGRASASADVAHAEAVERALAGLDLPVRVERNVDRIMLLPAGVEKAAGLLAALGRLGIPPARAAAIGDGENDVSMLRAVGHPVAVANAVPAALAAARATTAAPGGEGVIEWLAAWRAASAPAPRADGPRRG